MDTLPPLVILLVLGACLNAAPLYPDDDPGRTPPERAQSDQFNARVLAYDCSQPTVKDEISADEVAECESPSSWPSRSTYGTVVQSVTSSHIKLYACSVTGLATITRCGMHSHASIPINGITHNFVRMDRDACIRAHELKMWEFQGVTFTDLKVNSTLHQSVVVKGSKDKDGTCEGESFVFRETQYAKSTLEYDITIKLWSETAHFDFNSNKIRLANSLTCDYASLTCTDAETEYYWQPLPEQVACPTKYESLVSGPATIVSLPNRANQSEDYLMVNYTEYLFALKLTAKTQICNLEGFMTEHSRLFFIENPVSDLAFEKASPTNLDLALYVDSKFLYHEVATKQDLNALARDVVAKRCNIDRQNRLNMLAIARNDPSRLATFFGDPSLISYLSGEVLYVARCKPVMVAPRQVDQCYNSFPVWDPEEQPKFLSPFSHKIVDFAEEIACNPLLCPKFRFNDRWVKTCPMLEPVDAPTQLTPTQDKIEFGIESSISAAGFYTKSALKALGDHLKFGESRTAMTSSISRMAGGLSPASNALVMQNLFSMEQAKGLVRRAYMSVFGWLSDFFWWLSSLSGVVFMWNILKYFINVIINGIQLRNLVGCSSYLMFALWGSCSRIFVHHRFTEDINRRTEERLEEIQSKALVTKPVPLVRHTRESIVEVLEAERVNFARLSSCHDLD